MNDIQYPLIGCGTWTYTNKEAESNILLALEAGYRLIDTAEYYKNEKGVGKAVRGCGLPRGEIFVTSKLWKTHLGYKKAKACLYKTLDRLGLDYLDTYLIHWPAVRRSHENWQEINADTWRAFEEMQKEGLIRRIGVSNFMPEHLSALLDMCSVKPMVNQIEFHPGFMQPGAVSFCQDQGIALQAWSPFGRGEMFSNEEMLAIARQYGKSPAQICLRWIIQHGLTPIIKAASLDHLKNNLAIDDFSLDQDTVQRIDRIPFFGRLGYDPEDF